MKKITLSLCLLLFIGFNKVSAQQLTVSNIQIATAVQNRAPVGADTLFTADVGTLFCFTQIRGATDPTSISQVWYYKDQEKARVVLDVRSNNWRTWSSKTIMENWTGPWRVLIVDAEGNVLASKSFRIEGPEKLK